MESLASIVYVPWVASSDTKNKVEKSPAFVEKNESFSALESSGGIILIFILEDFAASEPVMVT